MRSQIYQVAQVFTRVALIFKFILEIVNRVNYVSFFEKENNF